NLPILNSGHSEMLVSIFDQLHAIGIEGLSAILSIHAMVADDPTIFVQTVVDLLQTQPLREAIGKRGNTLVNANYSAQRIGDLATYYRWDAIEAYACKHG